MQDFCLVHTARRSYVSTTTSTLPCAAATSPPSAAALHQRRCVLRVLVSRSQRLYINYAVRRDYSSPAARALRRPHRAPRLPVSGRTRSTSTSSCAATTRLRLHALYVNLVVHREYSSPLSWLQRSTSTTPHVRVPQHIAQLVTRLVAPLIVDYSGLVVDYFTSAARPGASARRAARHAARRAAHRRLLHLRHASGCLGMSRGSSRSSSRPSSSTTPPRAGSSSITSPPPRGQVSRHVAWLVAWLVAPLVVEYFTYAARPGASARRAARHTAHRLLLCAPQLRLAATLALLQPRRAW
jgi:hypothetical protein